MMLEEMPKRQSTIADTLSDARSIGNLAGDVLDQVVRVHDALLGIRPTCEEAQPEMEGEAAGAIPEMARISRSTKDTLTTVRNELEKIVVALNCADRPKDEPEA